MRFRAKGVRVSAGINNDALDSFGAALRAGASGRAIDRDVLRAATSDVLSAIRAELPQLAAPEPPFFAHLGRHVEEVAAPLDEAVGNVRAADLYLAFMCSSGDTSALRTFGERYDADVSRALRRVRKNESDVEDLAQELTRRMLVPPAPKIAEYSGRGDLRAWVRIVATRFALDFVRVKGHSAERATDAEAFGSLAATGDPPDVAFFRRRYRAEVTEAIALAAQSLTPEERNALREHYARGLTVDQIAATHGIHRATAARRVAQARETLARAVRRILDERHGLRGAELASVMGLVRSQLHVSMDRVLS